MDRSTWKKGEQRIAKLFGSTRTPLSGGNSKITRSDSLHPDLFMEIKHHQKHAHHTLMKETAKLAKKEGKIPILCTQQKYEKGFIISVRSEDLEEFAKIAVKSFGYRILKPKRK